ncbi:MAG: polyprenyl synthetase family protein [Candidatus Marinimicrobia bacterium]|nr:polyprenyl synthetase family protein [Candidatus Neomarinimicrobiota bacterium]
MNDLKNTYENYRKVIDQEISGISEIEELTYFRAPLLYPLKGQGKRFRPVLLLIVGKSMGQKVEALLPAAIAIEILHTFTLVHDDIMDNDKLRRGLPTVHKKWNRDIGILSGDGLFALAYRELMQTSHPRIDHITSRISQVLLRICEGQTRDLDFEKRTDITPQEYLNMVELKTGELIGLSCSVGAMLANADEKIVNKLDNFGKILGQAFQIQDDILEISSDESQMGKSLGSDFTTGKKTYPLTLVLSKLNNTEKKKFMSFLKNNSYNREEVLNKFQKYNAITEGEKVVNELMDQALAELDACPEKTRTRLAYFVELISNRDH